MWPPLFQIFVSNQEKFHAEANKNYWKAIVELIPNEVAAIEKKREKKDQERKPGIIVIRGPKPGKPTELSRMHQILTKLKHDTPPHLNFSPPAAPAATASVQAADVVTIPEAVSVA